MLPPTHVVPRPLRSRDPLTTARSYQRPSSAAGESNKSAAGADPQIARLLQRHVRSQPQEARGHARPIVAQAFGVPVAMSSDGFHRARYPAGYPYAQAYRERRKH